MSILDDVLQRLSEPNVSDAEIKRLIESCTTFAATFPDSQDIQNLLSQVKKAADDKMGNKDIKCIENISDFPQLKNTVDTYNATSGTRPLNPEKEALMADKLADFADKAFKDKYKNISGKELYDTASRLIASTEIENGTLKQKEMHAGSIATTYAFAVDDPNTKFTSGQIKKMMKDIDNLAEHIQYPDAAFANIAAAGLEDKSVAESFLKYTEKWMDKMAEKGQDSVSGEDLIKAYGDIVKHHPEMAQKCNALTKKAVENQSSDFYEYALDAAIQFSDAVNKTNGVKECDKGMARARKNSYQKQEDRLKSKNKQTKRLDDMEKEYSKNTKKSQEFDVSQFIDYGYDR